MNTGGFGFCACAGRGGGGGGLNDCGVVGNRGVVLREEGAIYNGQAVGNSSSGLLGGHSLRSYFKNTHI